MNGGAMDGFFAALGAVFVAELGDKTQLGILLATDRLRRPWPIFAGAAAALLTSTAIAAAVGGAAGAALPEGWLRLAGGLVFLAVGALTWWDLRRADDDDDELAVGHSARRIALAIFVAILLAEMGDKTQIVTAALAGTQDPWAAGAGAGLALVLSTALAVAVGLGVARLSRRARRAIRAAGGVLFLAFGVWYLVTAAALL